MILGKYGHDESAPTPNGVFAVYFVGDVDNLRNARHAFRGLTCVFHGVFIVYFVVECGHICVYS
ncbi:MAG: hypothetical protein HXN91_08860 [Prevotella pallens]|nr:hypothetical protein [Prevotella pallens]MBF1508169.1 hypothetical protein [Prevotella pallens]